jgi:hypothetical protein
MAMEELRVGHDPIERIHRRAGNVFSSQSLHPLIYRPGEEDFLKDMIKFFPVDNPLQGIFEMRVSGEILSADCPA